jgi:8-oxo-dGTP pyrophosphatase MutT (NUDIX family)
MKSAGVTPFRYHSDRLEALVCIGTVGHQRHKILSFGGAIDPGEAIDVAACRELHEESGMHVNGKPVTPDQINPCVDLLFPQTAERHEFFHYYLMIQPSDVVSFVVPSHQYETKAVGSIAGCPTEPISGTMKMSRVAWVPVDVLLSTENVFENFLEVLSFQPESLPGPVAQRASSSASAASASAASAEVVWNCAQCTFLNHGTNPQCAICASPSPFFESGVPMDVVSSVSQGIICPSCTYVNSAKNKTCDICGQTLESVRSSSSMAGKKTKRKGNKKQKGNKKRKRRTRVSRIKNL